MSGGIKISELGSAKVLTGSEKFAAVQGGETVAATVNQIKALIPAGADGTNGKDGVDGKDGMLPPVEITVSGGNRTLLEFSNLAYSRFSTPSDIKVPTSTTYNLTGGSLTGTTTTAYITIYPGETGEYVYVSGIMPDVLNRDRYTEWVFWRPYDTSAPAVTVSQIQAPYIPAKTWKRGTGGGNLSFGYPDIKSAARACGHMGSSVYWKTQVTLSYPTAGDTNVSFRAWLRELPCLEDGTIVPHVMRTDYVSADGNVPPSVAIWLICATPPTHLIKPETGEITQLTRGKDTITTGLPEYPIAPAEVNDGAPTEPWYAQEYFYTS
ncbi:hypothetical protein [Entomohabitans teleogrylli]|uniref:hypothetical protein n=1 Tax=Entomohabitans teleogrylli TaxID=1384589 RepID=UPI00073D388C|nr:hypothetical protein [Entomohabitans teleogrylli]